HGDFTEASGFSVLLTRKSFAFCKGFSGVLLGAHASCVLWSARILFTTKTRRIAKDFFASSCLRGEIPFGCGWAALCSSVVSFMLSGCDGPTYPPASWKILFTCFRSGRIACLS